MNTNTNDDKHLTNNSIEYKETNLPRIFELLDDDLFLTPKDISELIGVHPETVRRWCRNKKLRIIAPAGHYKILGKDLKEFLFRWYFNKNQNDRETS
ncbi:helix-turn-helix domain-containing protein [Ornithinibacillus californiensis]|uniref:helix-turn-helix domain-containing protein n=1 Tax=Ornithinibacillus californiensis TaxID=161536 RepID=UPI00064E0693|nr:helix-turn-helix domain-containing protein [Ornithinibacillus californiensis]